MKSYMFGIIIGQLLIVMCATGRLCTMFLIIFLGCLLHTHSVSALWSCSQDADCSSLAGSICSDGSCLCPPGTESVLGGTLCAEVAPYHTSFCLEDHQCSRLITSFECRRSGSEGGNCFCQQGFHYYRGRCWNSIDFGETCSRSEECMSVLRNPHSLVCNSTCECADGYYLRQRGECRKIGFAVGDGCVLNQDCQFRNAACDITTFRCYDTTAGAPAPVAEPSLMLLAELESSSRQHGAACSGQYPCPAPFVCNAGACICPVGYYASPNGTVCFAGES
ncbi:hypothetical protein O3G_MSEX013953 [Manduca sexta]|uniref:EB domain-containing protein n=1 Tax=Manduca sexta TaxID=7130 RepID=A0A921ZTG7_MANSE|nr:hypothetical protein O3G_MSEX013953 [Manduca sexta]